MEPFLGEVELFRLCGRPTICRGVFWKRTPCGKTARGNGQGINLQSDPLFLKEVYRNVNFFQKGAHFANHFLGHCLLRNRHKVSVSRKRGDEQLGGHMARKVRLRLKTAPWRTTGESEDQTTKSKMVKSEKKPAKVRPRTQIYSRLPPCPSESGGKRTVFSADYTLRP